MNFYFEGTFGWLVGDSYLPAQSCEIIISGTTVTVKSLCIPNIYYIFEEAVTDIYDSATTKYATVAALKTAITTFMTPA